MNKFTAMVTQIENIENLHLVSFEFGNQTIKMLSLELNELLEIESTAKLSVKSTNISIAKNFTGLISYANQLHAKVITVNNGRLLSSIQLSVEGFRFESVVTLEASLDMGLSDGDEVLVLIKCSEISVCG
ncbi:MAG TPA: transporter [Sulfurovum sp.]|nr:transporter [Sulfurovum sp.]